MAKRLRKTRIVCRVTPTASAISQLFMLLAARDFPPPPEPLLRAARLIGKGDFARCNLLCDMPPRINAGSNENKNRADMASNF